MGDDLVAPGHDPLDLGRPQEAFRPGRHFRRIELAQPVEELAAAPDQGLGIVEAFFQAEGPGEVDHVDLPVRADEDVHRVPVGVADELAEDGHVGHLGVPGGGIGGSDLLGEPRQLVELGREPPGQAAALPEELPLHGHRHHPLEPQQRRQLVGGQIIEVGVDEVQLDPAHDLHGAAPVVDGLEQGVVRDRAVAQGAAPRRGDALAGHPARNELRRSQELLLLLDRELRFLLSAGGESDREGRQADREDDERPETLHDPLLVPFHCTTESRRPASGAGRRERGAAPSGIDTAGRAG